MSKFINAAEKSISGEKLSPSELEILQTGAELFGFMQSEASSLLKKSFNGDKLNSDESEFLMTHMKLIGGSELNEDPDEEAANDQAAAELFSHIG